MKTIRSLFLITLAAPISALAQGSLTPPGAPAETMKTLSQVEPRTDLAGVAGSVVAMHRIMTPGSYYLSDNLDVTTTNGIEVRSSGVTLDLMGFTIYRSSPATAFGTAILIAANSLSNITIRNGHITGGVVYDSGAGGDQFTGTGFDYGIRENAYYNPTNVCVSRVHVSGCDLYGIALGTEASNSVDHCSVQVAGGVGIVAGEIDHCIAIDCGLGGINAQGNVSHCRGRSVSQFGPGIRAGGNVTHSYGLSTGAADGIDASGNVTNCYGLSNGTADFADGIHASWNVSNSYGRSSSGDGIHAGGNVSGSYGFSTSTESEANGIHTFGNAADSWGQSAGGPGIVSHGNVVNSVGFATGTRDTADGIAAHRNIADCYGESSSGHGIDAEGNVSNSYGHSNGGMDTHGIRSSINVLNSYGDSRAGNGIDAEGTVGYSKGSTGGGARFGIACTIAIGCTSVGGENITHKYLMP